MIIRIAPPYSGTLIKGEIAKDEPNEHMWIVLTENFLYKPESKLGAAAIELLNNSRDGHVLIVNLSTADERANNHLVLTSKDHCVIERPSYVVFSKSNIVSINELEIAEHNARQGRLIQKYRLNEDVLARIREAFLSSDANPEHKKFLQDFLNNFNPASVKRLRI